MSTKNKKELKPVSNEIQSKLITEGDLSHLTSKQKEEYYLAVCNHLGLNPVLKPFEILKYNGKEILYATRSASDQIRNARKLSSRIISKERINGVYMVEAEVNDGERFETSTGVVNIQNLQGDALANALMKAETKAKRRATLAFVGLSFMDETETETVSNAQPIKTKPAKKEKSDLDKEISKILNELSGEDKETKKSILSDLAKNYGDFEKWDDNIKKQVVSDLLIQKEQI
jgi:hypothetical protein